MYGFKRALDLLFITDECVAIIVDEIRSELVISITIDDISVPLKGKLPLPTGSLAADVYHRLEYNNYNIGSLAVSNIGRVLSFV